jgi:putative transposase
MLLDIQALWSPDVDPPSGGIPHDVVDFEVLVQVSIGEIKQRGGEVFSLTVCSDMPPLDSVRDFVEENAILGQKEADMGRQKHTAEQIVTKLREADVLLGKGMPLEEVVRQLGISDATYYKWRKEYGGLRVDQAKRLKELEQENSRLKKAVADLTLDNMILKEVNRGNS